MKIPNGGHADIGEKLREYLLNPSHPSGKHKARKFKAVLGISLENAAVLGDALVRAAEHSECANLARADAHGHLYELRLELATSAGSAKLTSAWIIRRGEDFPRLVTCFIL